MKTILFCNLPYAFSILEPLAVLLEEQGASYLWYVPSTILNVFPYKESPYTSDIGVLEGFKADVIFVPGNDVPYWLHGLKVQIFHGLAGEKKGHFRIRDYFDLYLTQGPYFTQKFQALAHKHKNFDVTETGWSKLDALFCINQHIGKEKETLLKKHQAKYIILYAPTFSPSLSSADKLFDTIVKLSEHKEILMIVKFHDKMAEDIKEKYLSVQNNDMIISDTKDITSLLQTSDLMISDTSSVVYEFILLNKPVLTLNSTSKSICWLDHQSSELLHDDVLDTLKNDEYQEKRKEIIAKYHPYTDGKSAQRMIEASKFHIQTHGVPTKRKLSLLRKWKLKRLYS